MRPSLNSSYHQQSYGGNQAEYAQNQQYPTNDAQPNFQDQQSRNQNQDQNRRPVHLQRRMYPGQTEQEPYGGGNEAQNINSRDPAMYPAANTYAQPTPTNPYEASRAPVMTANQYKTPYEQNARPNPPPNYPPPNVPASGQDSSRSSGTGTKIDTSKMPRPSLSFEEIKSSKYTTRSNVPIPSSNTNFQTTEDSVSGPRFLRMTFSMIPPESSVASSLGTPIGGILQPLAEQNELDEPISVVDYGEAGPFRCSRCKAYVNPFMTFTEGGNKAICNLCSFENAVPPDYVSAIDQFGYRRDRLERPELSKGTYEFVAPSNYGTRTPQKPNFVFCVEATPGAINYGYFSQVLTSIKSSLDYFQNPELTSIAIVTYDTTVQFYHLPGGIEKEPNIYIMGDIDDPFVPFPKEKLLFNVVHDREQIDYLIDKISTIQLTQKQNVTPVEPGFSCMGAAVKASKILLEEEGGKSLVFTMYPPTMGFGSIQARDKANVYNTDKEKTILNPATPAYVDLAKQCVEKRVGVDLFICQIGSSQYDLATIAPISNNTGGTIYYYTSFLGGADSERLHYDIFRNVSRAQGNECIFRTRCGNGMVVSEYYGAFSVKTHGDLELGSIDADTTLAFVLKHEQKLKENTDFSVQCALLYTSQFGDRRLRIFNFILNVTGALNNVYKSADIEAITGITLRKSILTAQQQSIKLARDHIINSTVNTLYNYRITCSTSSSPTQLILPDSLKLFPLYALACLKTKALRQFGEAKCDEKVHSISQLMKISQTHFIKILYPLVFRVSHIYENQLKYAEDPNDFVLPSIISATAKVMTNDDIYVMDNGEVTTIYVSNETPADFLNSVFGVGTFEELKEQEQANGRLTLPVLEDSLSNAVNSLVNELRAIKKGGYQSVDIVLAGAIREKQVLQTYLLEDQIGNDREFSYADFLCFVHKLIRGKNG